MRLLCINDKSFIWPDRKLLSLTEGKYYKILKQKTFKIDDAPIGYGGGLHYYIYGDIFSHPTWVYSQRFKPLELSSNIIIL